MSSVAAPRFGVRLVKRSVIQMSRIWQKLLGSNWCSSSMISEADLDVSSCSERHSSVLVRSLRWQPYSLFRMSGRDSPSDSRLTSR